MLLKGYIQIIIDYSINTSLSKGNRMITIIQFQVVLIN